MSLAPRSRANEAAQLAAAIAASEALAAQKASARSGEGNLAPFINNKGTVFFPQNAAVDHLCGQYSLNHILQEEKCVWVPNNNNKLIGGDNPKDPNVKINLWQMCNFYKEEETQKYKAQLIQTQFDRIKELLAGNVLPPVKENLSDSAFRRQQEAYTKELREAEQFRGIVDDDTIKEILLARTSNPLLDPGSLCKMDGLVGELPDGIFPYILNMLALRYEVKRGTEARIHLVDNIDDKKLLGVIFADTTHYIALVKYSNTCGPGEYTIIDSISCKTNTASRICFNKENTLHGMGLYITNSGRRGGESKGVAIFIYADDTSYEAEAVKRMKATNFAPAARASANAAGANAARANAAHANAARANAAHANAARANAARANAAHANAAHANAAGANAADANAARAASDQTLLEDILNRLGEANKEIINCNIKLEEATREIGRLKTQQRVKVSSEVAQRGSPALRARAAAAAAKAAGAKGGTRKYKKIKRRFTLRR